MGVLKEFVGQALDVASIFNPLNVMAEIWFWLLYNVLSPLLVITFTVLFFVGQYYLIKGYIWVGKHILVKLFDVYLMFHDDKTVKGIAEKGRKLFTMD